MTCRCIQQRLPVEYIEASYAQGQTLWRVRCTGCDRVQWVAREVLDYHGNRRFSLRLEEKPTPLDDYQQALAELDREFTADIEVRK